MKRIGYPLDSHVTYKEDGTPVLDRAISSAPYRKLIKSLFSDGVLPNPSTNLQVSAGTGMQVNLYAGFALCNGCQKLQEVNTQLTVPAANATFDRIDSVVLRLNDNDDVRECEFYVISGTAASTPARPTLTQTDSIWEIGLADILVKANSSQISNANITDTRYEMARCGIISSISEFDTTTLYQQVQADLEEFRDVNEAEIQAWFENIKGQMSGDVGINLQNQIGTLSNLKTEDKSSLVAAINELVEKEVDTLQTMEEAEAATDPSIPVGVGVVKELNDSLPQFVYDESTGEITGYTTKIGGADTVFPFSSMTLIGIYSQTSGSATNNLTFDLTSYEKYSELRLNENMIVCIENYGHGSNAGVNEAFTFTYDSSTGKLVVSHSGMYKMTIAVYAKSKSNPVNSGIVEAIADSAISVNLGFKPRKLSVVMYQSDSTWVSLNYNADADSEYYYTGYRASTSKIYRYNINTNTITPILKLTDSGFVFTANSTGTYHYTASS